jgi:cold shock CspA family protein
MSTAPVLQATVLRFDPADGSGSVITDNGAEIPFSGAAFARSGLRLLRAGQRVRCTLDGSGGVTLVTVWTLPEP